MARWCRACNRRIPEEHDVIGTRVVMFERGRIPGHRDRVYRCRVRPITNVTAFDFLAGGWVPGAQKVPETMQRTARNPARYAHESRFAEGGDLHA
jgi:hypothetical protein